MQILVLLVYIGLFIIFLILGFASIKYFITMWKFKNRKKDGSEDDEFRRFD
jgi:heme/copper-type cytochrome/quinol oxidase subunit 2